jgi:hypothetical protein
VIIAVVYDGFDGMDLTLLINCFYVDEFPSDEPLDVPDVGSLQRAERGEYESK